MTNEIVKFDTPELQVIEKSKAEQIKATFEPMAEMLEEFEQKYNELMAIPLDEITVDLTKEYKRLRLDVGRVRIDTGKAKDKAKEYLKLEDKAIMGIHNILVWAVKEKEDNLKERENYFEIQEQKRLEALQNERAELLSKYVEDAHERDLAYMEQDVWKSYLSTKKQAYIDLIEAEKKAEEKRIAKEKAEANAREEQRLENLRLKAEAEAREKQIEKERAEAKAKQDAIEEKARIEREKAEAREAKIREEQAIKDAKLKAKNDARLKKEQEAREKLEAEIKAKKEAEIKAESERKANELKAKKEAEKLAKAPVKKQLNVWVETFELPHLRTDNETALLIKQKFDAFKKWAVSEIEKL